MEVFEADQLKRNINEMRKSIIGKGEVDVAADFKPPGYNISDRTGVYVLGGRVYFCSMQKKKYGKKGDTKANFVFSLSKDLFEKIVSLREVLLDHFSQHLQQVIDTEDPFREPIECATDVKTQGFNIGSEGTIVRILNYEGNVRCDIRTWWFDYKGGLNPCTTGFRLTRPEFLKIFKGTALNFLAGQLDINLNRVRFVPPTESLDW